MTVAAIESWHESLADPVGGESGEWLHSELAKRGLMFGERPLCTVLRPRFLSHQQYDTMRRTIRVLLKAFDAALSAALADPKVMDQFHLEDWERTLVLEDPGYEASPLSRLDAFFSDDGELRFTEYNAETPAGSGYNDALTELFLALPAMRDFRRRYVLSPLPARYNVLHSLLRSHRLATGSRDRPTIAILDWREVPTQSEFRIFHDYFRSMGFSCLIADPRDTEYRQGALYAAGTKVDVIYKRVLINELVKHGGLDHPVVRAVRDRAVCMVNPFRCKVLHKKASLAVLSDERNQHLYSADQRLVIERYVPWTRVVAERRTEIEGREIDLVPFLAANRDQLVLKPNDDYGGAGVVLGWEAGQTEWESAIRKALAEPHIVQRRISLPNELFPSLVDGKVVYAERIVDTAPMCLEGAFVDSVLTRVSTANLVNVTAGGGSTIPTFLVEPRL
ncbi:MAG: hypothetical protein AB7S39_02150 [Gemmatimonadales bacterium]